MTKKFWKDWKKRYEQTSEIILNEPYEFYSRYHIISPMEKSYPGSPKWTIINAEFDADYVYLTIEKYNFVWKTKSHNKQIYFYPKVHRKDIKTVKFYQKEETELN